MKPGIVPVTILSGYLGAGKSTLLDRILTEKHDWRVAVIQNELGMSTGAEKLVTVEQDGRSSLEYVELPNGCVCCQVRDDLVLALEQLMQQTERPFDHVLVELSGMADPGPLASAFWLDDGLESPLRLDGIVTVVDSANLPRQLQAEPGEEGRSEGVNEAQRQLAVADRVLLNKCDLVKDEAALNSVEAAVAAINPTALRQRCVRSQVPLEFVLGVGSYRSRPDAEAIVAEASATTAAHSHAGDVRAVSLVEYGAVSEDEFQTWLGGLVWDRQSGVVVYRVKGVLAVRGESRKKVLQGVYELFELRTTEVGWNADEPESRHENRLVLIGKGLDAAILREQFQRLLHA